MEKTFKLPKEFAENWLAALRSEKYKQVGGTLVDVEYELDSGGQADYDKPIMETCSYCCLGVAAMSVGCEFDQIIGDDLLSDNKTFYTKQGIPEILRELVTEKEYTLVGTLTSLNDGCSPDKFGMIIGAFPNLVFPKCELDIYKKVKFNFKQIAEFIELNVEFV
jgi:hypothetical protein